MPELADIENRIKEMELHNQIKDTDKAWETSLSRRGLLILFTYLAIGFYLQSIRVNNPWLNAIVPAIGFLLSTLTLPFFKDLWLKYIYKK